MAHTWSDANFDDVGSRQDELLHHLSCHHISSLLGPENVNHGIFQTEQQVIAILCLGKHCLGFLTMMVWLGNFPRTVLTNSTKCSEYPLATSRQMYLISGMASRMLHSFSRSACPLPELAATCWGWEKRCCISSHHETLCMDHYNHYKGTAAFSSFNSSPGSD